MDVKYQVRALEREVDTLAMHLQDKEEACERLSRDLHAVRNLSATLQNSQDEMLARVRHIPSWLIASWDMQ